MTGSTDTVDKVGLLPHDVYHVCIGALHATQNLLNLVEHSIGHIIFYAARNNQATQKAVACHHFVQLHEILLKARAHADNRRKANAGTDIARIAHMIIQTLQLCCQRADKPSTVRHLRLRQLFHSLTEAQRIRYTARTTDTLHDG